MDNKKEFEFESGGSTFLSSPAVCGCVGCAFEHDFDGCNASPDCFIDLQYNPSVIFVEKRP